MRSRAGTTLDICDFEFGFDLKMTHEMPFFLDSAHRIRDQYQAPVSRYGRRTKLTEKKVAGKPCPKPRKKKAPPVVSRSAPVSPVKKARAKARVKAHLKDKGKGVDKGKGKAKDKGKAVASTSTSASSPDRMTTRSTAATFGGLSSRVPPFTFNALRGGGKGKQRA